MKLSPIARSLVLIIIVYTLIYSLYFTLVPKYPSEPDMISYTTALRQAVASVRTPGLTPVASPVYGSPTNQTSLTPWPVVSPAALSAAK